MRYIRSADIRGNGVVLTPTDVEAELAFIIEEIEKGTEQLVRHSEELALKEVDLELAEARAMLRASGKSIDMRKAEVRETTADLWRDVSLLRAKVRLIRDCQHDLRAELDAVRSIGASVRQSMWEGQGSGGSRHQ